MPSIEAQPRFYAQVNELRQLIDSIDNRPDGPLLDENSCQSSSDRLAEILQKLNLKSVLYSPLDEVARSSSSSSGFASATDWIGLLRNQRLGIRNDRVLESRDLDLRMQSLSHKWSVYGHRYVDGDDLVLPAPVYCVCMDPSGEFVVSGADDHLVKVWEVKTGLLRASLLGHSAEVCDIAFSACGRFIASLCTDDKSVIIWRKFGQDTLCSFEFFAKISESDLTNAGLTKLSPLCMAFYPPEHRKTDTLFSKCLLFLILAYTNGTVVIKQVSGECVVDFNRIDPPGPNYELQSFAPIPMGPVPSADPLVHLYVGLNRKGVSVEKSVVGYSVGRKGRPDFLQHAFPTSMKSALMHLAVSNADWSFVAADVEISTVCYCMQSATDRVSFAQKILLKSFVSGDAVLSDGSSLLKRLGAMEPGVPVFPSLKISVDCVCFSKNDEFIFCAMVGSHPAQRSLFTVLVFEIQKLKATDTISSEPLVGQIGLGKFGNNVFSMLPVEGPPDRSSILAVGCHDGTLGVYKVCGSLIVQLTSFNINSSSVGDIRSVLDISLVENKSLSETIVAVSDSLGTVSVFASLPWNLESRPPAEQFFTSEAFSGEIPASVHRGSGVLCDTRLVPLHELMTPSPAVIAEPVLGTGFSNRYNGAVISMSQNEFSSHMEISLSDTRPARGRGRPAALSEEQRQRRTNALQNLVTARAEREGNSYQRTDPLSTEEIEDDYLNSEIDDSDFSSTSSSSEEDSDSDEGSRRSRRRQSLRQPLLPSSVERVRVTRSSVARPEPTSAPVERVRITRVSARHGTARPEIAQPETARPEVNTIRVNRPSVSDVPARASARIVARASESVAPSFTLQCCLCHAVRSVNKSTYDRYTQGNIRVKCRYINYACDELQLAAQNRSVPPVAAARPPARPMRQRTPTRRYRNDSDVSEISEPQLSDSSFRGGPKRPRWVRRR